VYTTAPGQSSTSGVGLLLKRAALRFVQWPSEINEGTVPLQIPYTSGWQEPS